MKFGVYSLALLAMGGSPAGAKVAVVFRLASPPIAVAAGQQYSLCAANVGTVNVDLTLEFISVRTGAIVGSRDVTLPPPGSGGGMPDPCLATTAEALGASGSPPDQPPLLVGLVAIKRGLFARASAATASIQVTGTAPTGERRVVTSIPLHLATLINGRNTPIERVQ